MMCTSLGTFPWALEDCLVALQTREHRSALWEEPMVQNRKRNYMQMWWYLFWDTYTTAVPRPPNQHQLTSGIRKRWSEKRHEMYLWHSGEIRKRLGPPWWKVYQTKVATIHSPGIYTKTHNCAEHVSLGQLCVWTLSLSFTIQFLH